MKNRNAPNDQWSAKIALWSLVRDSGKFPGFNFKIERDDRGKPQIVTSNHPRVNGEFVSLTQLVQHCRNEISLIVDQPGQRHVRNCGRRLSQPTPRLYSMG